MKKQRQEEKRQDRAAYFRSARYPRSPEGIHRTSQDVLHTENKRGNEQDLC